MTFPIKSPRKLIEVALPLDAINVAAAREKSIRHGHPSTLHLWWARRPLAAARAVIFAQLVNDPGYQQGGGFKYGKNKKEAAIERKRLFKIIEDLVLWENTTNEDVLERARAEIRRSWREVCELNKTHPQAAKLFNPGKLPALHDPFAGGGSIPTEAQRLGLEAYASDLNPVAVLINKAMIEIPPRFAGYAPVGPFPPDESGGRLNLPTAWPGVTGLAENVRRYGAWMRAEAQKRIGRFYPRFEITEEIALERPDLKPLVGQKLTVIAWLWARTVKSPNPAFSHVAVPLASTFILASKEGKNAYVQPVVKGDTYRFNAVLGVPPPEAEEGTKANGRGANFRCIISDAPISGDYIKSEALAGRMGKKLMAIVAEGTRSRIYLSPTIEMEEVAEQAVPSWKPDVEFFQQALGFRVGNYGMTKWSDLFTSRQLVALTTFSDLVTEVREKVRHDAVVAGMPDDGQSLDSGGTGATAYAEATCVYLAFAVDRSADFWCNLCIWANQPKNELVGHMFSRQAISMAWDFGENNPFSDSGGNFTKNLDYVVRGIQFLPSRGSSSVFQGDAAKTSDLQPSLELRSICTDPPYYDNIGYADLSDFFYVWLRQSLRAVFPRLLATISVPKAEELVATPARHGGLENAERFFLLRMTETMRGLASLSHPDGPVTIFYAFKQSDTSEGLGTSSTGWETFLEAVHRAGLQLTGTWPMRTERQGRMRGNASNALASSIILVCRKRAANSPSVSRREFLRELNAVLPEALDEMTKGSGDDRSPVAPVDLSQAIIGPGMAVFSKYSAVLEADGKPMSVHTALQLINRFLAEDDFDPDTQFCLHWFEQHGWGEGRFGDADTLSRAKGTSVDRVRDAGVVESGGGIVRLRKWSEYPVDWDPQTDTRNPVWETLHHLIRALKQEGETGAGRILAAVKGKAEAARQLSYRLYTLCERQSWAEDARAYNELITSWTGIESAAGTIPTEEQSSLFEP
jgi:putative DNA methylase